MPEDKKELEFYGGRLVSLVPVGILVVFCILFFAVWRVYSMSALAMGGFIAVILGSFLAKNNSEYWGAVIRGITNETAVIVMMINLTVSFFGKIMSRSAISAGFVWIGQVTGLTGSMFCTLTFILSSLLALTTGTSMGTVLALFPFMYPAGVMMGGNPAFVAGAIISGAMLGDSISPISDMAPSAAGPQTYKNIPGSADIGGATRARLKIVLVSAVLACVVFMILGGSSGGVIETAEFNLAEYGNPKNLVMIIPVALLLFTAIKTKNIFLSITVGIITGLATGLAFGIFSPADIMTVEDGELSGILIDGMTGNLGTVAFLFPLFGCIGLLQESGLMDAMIQKLLEGRLGSTERGSELIIIAASTIGTPLLGAANAPAALMLGPLADRLGKAHDIHPYRRANLLAVSTSALPAIVPFTSMYIISAAGLINGLAEDYAMIQPLSPMAIPLATVYCITSFIVCCVSALTGWDRTYEGSKGETVKYKEWMTAHPDAK